MQSMRLPSALSSGVPGRKLQDEAGKSRWQMRILHVLSFSLLNECPVVFSRSFVRLDTSPAVTRTRFASLTNADHLSTAFVGI